jgi:hypothetical protein
MDRVLREGETVVAVVVQCVAEETGRDPTDLRPFAESIDADAVEALFGRRTDESPGQLQVEYEGCRVTIDRESVTVEPLHAIVDRRSGESTQSQAPSS